MKKGIIASLLLLLSSTSVLHSEEYISTLEPMYFVVHGDGSIQANGVIDDRTVGRLNALAGEYPLEGRTLYINSAGGLIPASLTLGRMIRKNKMNVVVGEWVQTPLLRGGSVTSILPARCDSICPFVVLGGIKRRVTPFSNVGVHQMWLSNKDPDQSTFSATEMQAVQRSWGQLAQYVGEMKGSNTLLLKASLAPPNHIKRLSPQELKSTRVVN